MFESLVTGGPDHTGSVRTRIVSRFNDGECGHIANSQARGAEKLM
jgi:hypothetical protein